MLKWHICQAWLNAKFRNFVMIPSSGKILREEEPGAETSLFKQKQDESKCQEYVSVS
jgi:hypothetical protein